MHVFAHVGVLLHVGACLRLMQESFLITLPSYSLSQGLSTKLETTDMAGLASELALGTPLCLPRLELQDTHMSTQCSHTFSISKLCSHTCVANALTTGQISSQKIFYLTLLLVVLSPFYSTQSSPQLHIFSKEVPSHMTGLSATSWISLRKETYL